MHRRILEVVSPDSDELPYPILRERHCRVIPAQVGENLTKELLVVCCAYALLTGAQTLIKQLSHRSSSPLCNLGAANLKSPTFFTFSITLIEKMTNRNSVGCKPKTVPTSYFCEIEVRRTSDNLPWTHSAEE